MGSPGLSDNKATVLAATDIVELIGQSVALKRRGKDFVGLCPFHQEKSPSFHVSPARQFYHCFGCKESGNAIDFVIKRDRVEFIDALRMLADRAGIELARSGASAAKAGERQMLHDAHSVACQFFESLLWDPQRGAAARAYLAKRGFADETLKKFRVGLAADSWDALLKSPGMRKFPPDKLAEAGLVKARQSGGGFYDTFRNRIMFPILEEAQARIIAFGGRVVPGSQDPAKYLNSPETPLFSKSRTVYGLNFARQRMIETGTAVVVEGYTDVVMAHQFGASNVVSVLGTAMTEQHVNVLRRFANKIVLLFDADFAGNSAADRVVELFLTQDIEIAIASMPEGMDPDEYFLKFGVEGFERDVIGKAKDVLSYKWDQLFHRMHEAGGGDVTSQQKAVGAYLDLLAQARGSGPVDEMRWGAVLARVSRLTEMPLDDLHRRFRKPAKPNPPVRRTVTNSTNNGGIATPQVTTGQGEVPTPSEPEPEAQARNIAREVAERQILGILLKEPGRWQAVQLVMHPESFTPGRLRRLAEVYWDYQRHEGEPVFPELLGTLEADLKEPAIRLLEDADGLPDVDAALRGALGFFEDERRRREEQKQLAEIRRISQQGAGSAASADQAALWAEFVKKNASVDPRRLGPVRRTRS